MNSCLRFETLTAAPRATCPTVEGIRKLGVWVEGSSPVRLSEFRGLFLRAPPSPLPATHSVTTGELINLSDLQSPLFTKCRCCEIYLVGPPTLRRYLKAPDPYFVSSENILLLLIATLPKP